MKALQRPNYKVSLYAQWSMYTMIYPYVSRLHESSPPQVVTRELYLGKDKPREYKN